MNSTTLYSYKRKRDDRPNQNRPGDIHGIPVRNAALRLLLALSEALPKVGVLDQSDQCCRDLVTTCYYLLHLMSCAEQEALKVSPMFLNVCPVLLKLLGAGSITEGNETAFFSSFCE